MKFILRILLAPIMLVLWFIEWILSLSLKISSLASKLISFIFILASIYHFVNGSILNGCFGLVIAFLFSSYGLPKLAIHLVAWFIAMRILLKEKIYG